jgi:hypothetical protein
MEELEDRLFDNVPRGLEVQRRSFQLRKSLVLLRRIVIPMSEVVSELMRRDLHIVGDDLMPYYQDVYDQVLRAAEWTDGLRDLVTSILETRQAGQLAAILGPRRAEPGSPMPGRGPCGPSIRALNSTPPTASPASCGPACRAGALLSACRARVRRGCGLMSARSTTTSISPGRRIKDLIVWREENI